MSLIHLEKSVLTFHLKEILEDGHGNHPLTWLSLGILIFGPKLLPSTTTERMNAKRSRPAQMSLSQWIAQAQQRELQTQFYTAIANYNSSGSKMAHSQHEPSDFMGISLSK